MTGARARRLHMFLLPHKKMSLPAEVSPVMVRARRTGVEGPSLAGFPYFNTEVEKGPPVPHQELGHTHAPCFSFCTWNKSTKQDWELRTASVQSSVLCAWRVLPTMLGATGLTPLPSSVAQALQPASWQPQSLPEVVGAPESGCGIGGASLDSWATVSSRIAWTICQDLISK